MPYPMRIPRYGCSWLFTSNALIIFAIRQPARYTTKRPLEILVTLLSLIYFLAFDVKPTSSAVLGLVGGVRHCHRLNNNDHFHPVLGLAASLCCPLFEISEPPACIASCVIPFIFPT